MTTYYVGIGGNDGNNGTSWATRKLTLNGAEDIPVVAGDTVYVGAGTYRERLICDVSGSSGSPITYIGDYDGSHTDGVGGVVRITGSDDDQSATRTECIYINSKDYRTFQGFYLDTTTGELFEAIGCDHLNILNVYFGTVAGEQLELSSVGDGHTFLIDGCYFSPHNGQSLYIYASGDVAVASGIVSNCIFQGRNANFSVRPDNVGDLVFKNCLFESYHGMRSQAIPSTDHPVVVNNCIFHGCSVGIYAAAADGVVEDYNCFSGVGTARTNVGVGANSVTYPMLPDTRWFFEMVGGGSMLTPFDLASYSQLINVAGTSPTTADMRGTTVQGTQREWGALEYDSALDIEAGSGTTYVRGLLGCG